MAACVSIKMTGRPVSGAKSAGFSSLQTWMRPERTAVPSLRRIFRWISSWYSSPEPLSARVASQVPASPCRATRTSRKWTGSWLSAVTRLISQSVAAGSLTKAYSLSVTRKLRSAVPPSGRTRLVSWTWTAVSRTVSAGSLEQEAAKRNSSRAAVPFQRVHRIGFMAIPR